MTEFAGFPQFGYNTSPTEYKSSPVGFANLSDKIDAKFDNSGSNFFTSPRISENTGDNGYNGFPIAYEVYKNQLVNATPDSNNFDMIGCNVNALPGPNLFENKNYVPVNGNSGRMNNLSLAAQNSNTFGNTQSIASSLLPSPSNKEDGGFETCDTKNILANQVFLSPGQALGTDTIAGSLRNANQSLRSEPPNPVNYVGPWNLSSIFPDLTRRPLEGCGPSFGLYGTGEYSSQVPTKITM